MASVFLTPDCEGDFCGARGNSWLGKGWGIWKYDNTGDADAELNIKISDLKRSRVTIVLSNFSDQEKIPGGDLTPRTTSSYYASEVSEQERVAAQLDNTAYEALIPLKEFLSASPPVTRDASSEDDSYYDLPVTTWQAGTTHTWKCVNPAQGGGFTESDVVATLMSSMQASDGKYIHLWAENGENLQTSGTEQAKNLLGSLGNMYEAVTKLTEGDIWGAHHSAELIAANTTDLHLLAQNMQKHGWPVKTDGFFYTGNNYASYSPSNHALMLYVNAETIAKNTDRCISTLAHELTHMINFYERRVKRDVPPFELWLEEGTALATEDILADSLFPGNTPGIPRFHAIVDEERLSAWIELRNICSLTTPQTQSGALPMCTQSTFYVTSSVFMSFLLRHYGIKFYRALLKSSKAGIDAVEYALESAMHDTRGSHVALDEWPAIFRRWGALLALMPDHNIPRQYGLPQHASEGYTLAGIDLSTFSKEFKSHLSGYLALNLPKNTILRYSHGTIIDENQSGVYERIVTIPAGMSAGVYVNN